MGQLLINHRDTLGELWLPWCVDRRDPTRMVYVARDPERAKHARQLRVRDVPDHHAALVANDGLDSVAKIEQYAAAFRSLGEITLPSYALPGDDPRAYPLPDGSPMMREACHRTCALYVAGVPFVLTVELDPALDWEYYADESLREE